MSRTPTGEAPAGCAKPPPRHAGRALLLLAGVLLLGANLRATLTAVGPVLGDIREALGIGAATASVLVSAPLVGFAVISPIAPAIARRYGIEPALAAALALLAVATVVRSLPLTGAIWVGTALLGVAIALMNVLLPALVKRGYPERIGAVTGGYIVAQSAAAAVAAGLAVPIAHTAAGWPAALGVWAALAVVGLAVFAPQLRRNREPVASAGSTTLPRRRSKAPWRSALAWQVTLFMGLQSTSFYVFITWWPSIEHSEGVPQVVAGWHQFAFLALNILGGILAGILVQRLRDQRLSAGAFAVLFFLAAGGQLLFPGLALLWVVLAGISAGGSIVVALSLFGLHTTHHDDAAALSGMAQSIGYLLAAGGPIVFGLLHDFSGTWRLPLVALVLVTIAQFIFGVLAGRRGIIAKAGP